MSRRGLEPKGLTVVSVEVPCCSGLTRIAQYALGRAESTMPLTDVNFAIGGESLACAEVTPLPLRP